MVVHTSSPAQSPGAPIHVRKLRPDGSLKLVWEAQVLSSSPSELVARSEFGPPEVDLGPVTLQQGDVFVEFYYWDRWYTIAQVFAPVGMLNGWYCDVCEPPRWDAPGVLSYLDLDLDLWRDADGMVVLLDEDEFAAHVAQGAFNLSQLDGARQGWAELRLLAEHGRMPSS